MVIISGPQQTDQVKQFSKFCLLIFHSASSHIEYKPEAPVSEFWIFSIDLDYQEAGLPIITLWANSPDDELIFFLKNNFSRK